MTTKLVIKLGKNFFRDVEVLDKNGKKVFSFLLFADGTMALLSASELWTFEDSKVDMRFRNKITGNWSGGEDKVLHIPDKILSEKT